jgi:hypothetical protein
MEYRASLNEVDADGHNVREWALAKGWNFIVALVDKIA